jgi:hypothetical protein
MPEEKRIIEIHKRNDSLQITYDRSKGEFVLSFDPELNETIRGVQKVVFHLVLKEHDVRAMADVLPPLDPESVH